jgi:predicted hydrolase (HD superfamily)
VTNLASVDGLQRLCLERTRFGSQSGDRVLNKARALDLVRKHLAETPRAAHSRFVAYLMRELASIFDANADIWEMTGLCHDLDFFVTSGDWSQHGLVTIRWLAGQLPDDALPRYRQPGAAAVECRLIQG